MEKLTKHPYNRGLAVAYAHRWAFGRNPAYLNFDGLGGDCTNFASQCLYAGSGTMDNRPTFGWYYYTASNRTPSWTGVPYFYNYLTRAEKTPGPAAEETELDCCESGDFVQLAFLGKDYVHTPVIVQIEHPASLKTTLVAAHTFDADYRPLSSYDFESIRFLHITGVWKRRR